MDLCRDEAALGAALHGRLLCGTLLLGEHLVVTGNLLNEVGGDAGPSIVDILKVKLAVRLGGVNSRASEIGDSRGELLASGCVGITTNEGPTGLEGENGVVSLPRALDGKVAVHAREARVGRVTVTTAALAAGIDRAKAGPRAERFEARSGSVRLLELFKHILQVGLCGEEGDLCRQRVCESDEEAREHLRPKVPESRATPSCPDTSPRGEGQ